MKIFMKETGKIIKLMGKEHTLKKMEIYIQEILLME